MSSDASELSLARIQLGSAREIFKAACVTKLGEFELNLSTSKNSLKNEFTP